MLWFKDCPKFELVIRQVNITISLLEYTEDFGKIH